MTIGMYGRLAVIALIGFLGPGSLPAVAELPSSPAEKAETAQLNHDIAAANAAADVRFEAAKKQYDEQKAKDDEQQQRYQEEVKQTEVLQQQYQEKLSDYQKAYRRRTEGAPIGVECAARRLDLPQGAGAGFGLDIESLHEIAPMRGNGTQFD